MVVNLAGEPVADGRLGAARKRRVRESRVLGTRNLVAALAALPERPSLLVSASAVGYYGHRGDEVLVESSAPGEGFLAEVCQEWEREARAAEALGIRVVTLRIGVVLAPGGGALARMLPPFRMGVGGALGSGRQWMPWMHVDDVVGLVIHAMRDPGCRGAMNAVAPTPVTNAEFTRTLGRALHRPTLFPVPRVALRVAIGDLADVLLSSQRVRPDAALERSYAFLHPHLEDALADVLGAAAA